MVSDYPSSNSEQFDMLVGRSDNDACDKAECGHEIFFVEVIADWSFTPIVDLLPSWAALPLPFDVALFTRIEGLLTQF